MINHMSSCLPIPQFAIIIPSHVHSAPEKLFKFITVLLLIAPRQPDINERIFQVVAQNAPLFKKDKQARIAK